MRIIKPQVQYPEMLIPRPEAPENITRDIGLATLILNKVIRDCCRNIDDAAKEPAGNV